MNFYMRVCLIKYHSFKTAESVSEIFLERKKNTKEWFIKHKDLPGRAKHRLIFLSRNCEVSLQNYMKRMVCPSLRLQNMVF